MPAPAPVEPPIFELAVGEPAITAAPASPAAMLVAAQVKTLADLCSALDRKCLDLLEELAAARSAPAVTAQELADLRVAHAQELAYVRETHEREQAETRRNQAMLERELAALRLVLDRTSRPGTGRANRQQQNGEHAARLLPLLEASLAAKTVLVVHDIPGALVRFRVAGMIDTVDGTRDAPTCHGWLLSRSDLPAEPLMFLMDDVGLLGWTDANQERQDVNAVFPNTKPRPGFKAPLSRVPVGRLRAIVAVADDSNNAVFFEASSKAVPKNLFLGKRG